MKLILKIAACILLISEIAFTSCKKDPVTIVDRPIHPKILNFFVLAFENTSLDSLKTFSTPTLPLGYSIDSSEYLLDNSKL